MIRVPDIFTASKTAVGAALAALLALAACTPGEQTAGGGTPPGSASAGPSVSEEAQELVRLKRFEEAAQLWLAEAGRAARARDVETAASHRLNAAEALLGAANRQAQADQIARELDPAILTPHQRTRRALVLVRVARTNDQAEEAFELLPPLDALRALPGPSAAPAALALAADTAHRAEHPFDELRFRAALDAEPAGANVNRGANREAIWTRVRALSDDALLAPPGDVPPSIAEDLAGWFELERLLRTHSVNFPTFSREIEEWRARHPGHTADVSVLPRLFEQMQREGLRPNHIALLLPLTGPFAAAAAATRDGFLAGWHTDAGETRPVVSVYDTGDPGKDPESIYRTAVAQGADFVVGPLRKEAIGRIAALPDRSTPLLLLNALPTTAGDAGAGAGTNVVADVGTGDIDAVLPVFQFTLSPEDEARRVAEFARANRHFRAGLLVPDSAWGRRVADAFTARWEETGASIVAHVTYRETADDLLQPVEELLAISENVLGVGGPEHYERLFSSNVARAAPVRGGLDCIVLIGFPREARLLRPLITFRDARDIPIYATSHVFSGSPEPHYDIDLEGIVFNDMPWVLDQPATQANGEQRERIVGVWPAAVEGFTRFYAFGLDAYGLQKRLHRLAAHPGTELFGHTGHLSIEPGDGRIRIERPWARFENGVPVPFRPAG